MKINFSTISIILLCFVFFMTSCEKEVVDSILNSNKTDPNGITVGMPDTSMYLSSFVLRFHVKPKTSEIKHHTLDLDNDGLNDIGFEMNSQYSSTLGQRTETFIYTINSNASIFSYSTTDTIFQKKDTTTNKITNTISCSRISPNDLILQTIPNQKKIHPLYKREYLGTSGFLDGKIKLNSSSYSTPEANITPPYTYSTYYNNDCSNIPTFKSFFLGIKIVVERKIKLGWILINHPKDNEININGFAMQL